MTVDEIAQITEALRGQSAGPRYVEPESEQRFGPRSNELSRAVPALAGIDQLRSLLGPMVAQAAGLQVAGTLPTVAPGQGIGEAWYASRVSGDHWEKMQQEAQFNMAKGLGTDVGSVINKLGGPQAIGITNTDFKEMLKKQATDPSQAGMAIASYLMSSPALEGIRGGNPMATYEGMFANRNLFGEARGLSLDPLNERDQTWSRQVATDMANSLTQAVRGNGLNSAGLLPNFEFTRGFKDEDITRMALETASVGKYGDLGKRLMMKNDSGDAEGYTREIDLVTKDVGEAAQMFEALGDLVGSRDMDTLIDSLDQLSGGQWRKADFVQVKSRLRDMEATAQIMNITKDEMFKTVTSIQQTMQGSMGLSAHHVAMGFTGGGYASIGGALDMSQSVFATASATGDKSAAGMNRISTQQQGLMAIGMNSQAGRAAQVMAYLHQQGTISDSEFAEVQNTMKTGTSAERTSIVDSVMANAFGSAKEGRKMMNDPNYMLMVREKTTDAAAARARDMIVQGQGNEYRERSEVMQRRVLKGMLKSGMRDAGMNNAADPDTVADTRVKAITEYLSDQGEADGATHLQKVYDDAIAGGKTKSQAMDRVQSQLRGTGTLKKFAAGAVEAADRKQLEVDVQAYEDKGMDATKATTILNDIRGFGTDKMSEGQKEEMEQIRKQVQTDPAKAAAAAGKFYENADFLSDEQKRLIKSNVVGVEQSGEKRINALRGAKTSWERMRRGGEAGMTQGEIEKDQEDYSQWLREAKAGEISGKELEKRVGTLRSFSGEDKERIAGVARGPDLAKNLDKEIARQGAVNVSSEVAKGGVAGKLALAPELAQGIYERQRGQMSAGRLRAMTAGQAEYNQSMADLKPELRMNFSQLAAGYATGNIDLATMLGVEEGAAEFIAGDPKLKKRVDKFNENVGLEDYTKELKRTRDKAGKADDAYTKIQTAAGEKDPAMATKMDAMREDYYRARSSGGLKTEADVEKFMASDKYKDVGGDAKSALREIHQGREAEREVHTKFKAKFKEAAEKDPKLMTELTEKKAKSERVEARTRRKANEQLAILGEEGLGFVEDMGDMKLSGEDKKLYKEQLKILVPEAQKGKTREQTAAAMAKDGKGMKGLSAEKHAAAGKLAELYQRKQDEGSAGKGAKTMRLTGILRMVNAQGQAMGTVNMDSSGSYGGD